MKFTYLIFVVPLLLATYSDGLAQGKKWLDLEAGVALHRVQDLGHSLLIYKGQALFMAPHSTKRQTAFEADFIFPKRELNCNHHFQMR